MRAVSAVAVLLSLTLLCSPKLYAQQEENSDAQPVFEFHSGFWVNLHHFLYQQGRVERARADAGPEQGVSPQYRSFRSIEELTPQQRVAWNSAVQIYAESWSSRDLLLNNQMVLINNRLAELEDCPELAGRIATECTSGIVPELVTALGEAAPIYRQNWWVEQDRANRAWIAAMAPVLRNMGADLAGELADIYQSKWPIRIHVDVVNYAGQQGAYTSLAPLHVMIASDDSRNRGLSGIETLFYQASHVLAVGLEQAIERECRRLQKPVPRDLWNAVLLYTTVERTGRIRATAQTDADTTSKAATQANGNTLGARGWGEYDLLLRRYWQPYLDGQVDMDTAVAHLINAI
ncbi:MAG TPA: hypothetical protein VFB23_06295 [Candidatus Acidoferrales bacterium]|nr:hypothetical protein [Candidatus Acidoferrales bacterium]